MAKFSGYLTLPVSFGVELGGYLINDQVDYANFAAMVVDTMMHAGISLFNKAEVERRCRNNIDAETSSKKACAIMNTLYAWKDHPEKRPPECAVSWLDDAWCTLHQKYEELHDKEIV